MLNVSFASLAPTKQVSPDDYNHIQNLRKIIHEFNLMLGAMMITIKDYLDIQMKGCFYEQTARAYASGHEVRAFSGIIPHNVVENTIGDIAKNHAEEIKALIELVSYLHGIPRPNN
jgi:hypothetical protein